MTKPRSNTSGPARLDGMSIAAGPEGRVTAVIARPMSMAVAGAVDSSRAIARDVRRQVTHLSRRSHYDPIMAMYRAADEIERLADEVFYLRAALELPETAV